MSTVEIQQGENKNAIKEGTESFLNLLESNLKNKTITYRQSKSIERVLEAHDKCKTIEEDRPKSKLELLNLYVASVDLKRHSETEQDPILELSILKETHKILMNGLLDGKTAPGQLSNCDREGSFKGCVFKYPTFEKEGVASAVLTALIDDYNSSVYRSKDKIANNTLTKPALQRIFQSAAKFLFIFLQLHPFADGNGRLGRLLCSHFLKLVCPFPSSIYNVYSPTDKSDYVKVLVNAREGISLEKVLEAKQGRLGTREEGLELYGKLLNHDESELASLIIESNWFSWRKFLSVLDKKIPEFNSFNVRCS